MRAVEAVHIQENHLQEASRQKLRRQELAPASEDLVLYSGLAAVQRLKVDALGKHGAAQEVFVAVGSRPSLLVRPQILDVGLDERGVLANQNGFCVLLRYNAVDCRLGAWRLLGRQG